MCLVQFQQSRRLLQLSSREEYEKLIQETEAIRDDILAESTPDWLLVQVRPSPFTKVVEIQIVPP